LVERDVPVAQRLAGTASPTLKQIGLFLEFLQRRAIRLGQDALPIVAQPRVVKFRLYDERHAIVIFGHGFIRRGGEHGVFPAVGRLAPQTGRAKHRFARLKEPDADFVKTVRQQQATLVEVGAELVQPGD